MLKSVFRHSLRIVFNTVFGEEEQKIVGKYALLWEAGDALLWEAGDEILWNK